MAIYVGVTDSLMCASVEVDHLMRGIPGGLIDQGLVLAGKVLALVVQLTKVCAVVQDLVDGC